MGVSVCSSAAQMLAGLKLSKVSVICRQMTWSQWAVVYQVAKLCQPSDDHATLRQTWPAVEVHVLGSQFVAWHNSCLTTGGTQLTLLRKQDA